MRRSRNSKECSTCESPNCRDCVRQGVVVCTAGLNMVPFPGDIRSPSILESSSDVALFCVNLFHGPTTPFRRELGGSVRTQ